MSAVRVVAGLTGAMFIGLAVALQTRGNGELGRVWADPYAAALWSFGSGLVLVIVGAVAMPSARSGLRRLVAALRDGELPLWAMGGGLVGACFVLSQVLVSPVLGVALFTVGTVAGQSIGGLLIDRIGIGPGGVRAITPTRVVGGALMIVAVGWGAVAQFTGAAQVAAVAVPFVVGVAMGAQQAANGRVRQAARSALVATLVNFGVGTVILAVIFVVHAVSIGGPRLVVAPVWAYLGGVIGVLYIAASAVLVQELGVLLLSLGVVAGQVLGSLLVDLWLPTAPGALTVTTVVSALLTVAAVAITALPTRRARVSRAG